MKIKQARIFNYGKWHNVTIPFRAGLNVLYGQNEAGKTTLISFIKGVLFGFLQRRTSHKSYIPKNSKNYGGQLDLLFKGHEYIVQRMAGKNGGDLTVLDINGHQLDRSVLSRILGPFNRETFNALYYFGTVNLQKMGKLKQKDLIYRIQRIGLAHSDEWINYREALIKRSKKLYSPRGYKPPLNQELKQYTHLIDQAKDAKNTYHDYQDLTLRIKQLKDKHVNLDRSLTSANQRASQLKHDQDVWLRYQKMKQLRPFMSRSIRRGFTDHDVDHLRKLKHRLTDLTDQVNLAHQQFQELNHQEAKGEPVENYYNHQAMINKLANQFDQIQRYLHDFNLIKDRRADVVKRLNYLKSNYHHHNQLSLPMNSNDLETIKNLNSKMIKGQTYAHALGHKLVTLQTHKRLATKDYVMGGFSVLLIIIGLVIKLWLLAGLGAVILVLNFWISIHKGYQQRLQQIQARLRRIKLDNEQSVAQLRLIQTKYHYPTLNVEEWLANQGNLRQLQKLSTNHHTLNGKINKLQQTIHDYFTHWSFINRDITLDSNASSRLLQLKNYVNKMDHIVRIDQRAKEQGHKVSKKLKQLNHLHGQAQKAISDFYHNRQVRDINEFESVKEQQSKLSKQQVTYRELSKQISGDEVKNLSQYETFDDLKEVTDRVNHQIMDLKARSQRLTNQSTALRVKLRQMVKNGSYDELQQRIANYRTQINELAKRWLEDSLASQWINATLNLATKGRVPKIEHRAQINFQILTNHRYVSIVFNKSKIKVMRKDKRRFTLYELSKGTVQQLYLALIFAMAQVFSPDYPMPVLIDDGFTDFDVNRKRIAVNLLKSIGKKLQIIYCTSDYTLANRSETLDLSKIKSE